MKQLEQQQNAKKRKQAEEVANAQDVATQLEQTSRSRFRPRPAATAACSAPSPTPKSPTRCTQQLSVAIDRHKIEMKDGIKALGTYPVEIRLGNNVIAKSAVQVVALK